MDRTKEYQYWDTVRDLSDQLIDLMLNYRQSGHPGGSRSKVPAFVTLLLGGHFRWDIRKPEATFGDRFILSAGHTVPLVYAVFAVLDEAMRLKFRKTGDQRYALRNDRAVFWEDLPGFRHRGGLSGHAEMSGKTMFLKWNTGPSGHGLPAAVGQALALKKAGADSVRVVALEGEGGLTPGASHEAKNSAWGLGLGNLFFLVDWNDFGIDDRPHSSVVHGSPADWFEPYGWRIGGTEQGDDWASLDRGMAAILRTDSEQPGMFWFKTRKGRGYLVYDNKSHGAAHKMNSDIFWKTKEDFAQRYAVNFDGFGQSAPEDPAELAAQYRNNLQRVLSVLERQPELVDYLCDTLLSLADKVPEKVAGFTLAGTDPWTDPELSDPEQYPESLFFKPGEQAANRTAFGRFGSWVNSRSLAGHGKPLFVVASADLAESTSIAGFGHDWPGLKNAGWYKRDGAVDGVILPQEITEFTNAGIMAGMASVNFAADPEKEFIGYHGACSTYAAFSYLKYGEMRLYSQIAQDNPYRMGSVIWVAGHSGPETAEDFRTHYGIFSPGVTQLFPDGKVINLYPWDPNEVPWLLARTISLQAPVIALHLTRPNITVPDRAALGMDPASDAVHGLYRIRRADPERQPDGTIIVHGASAVANLVKTLPELDERGWNLNILCAVSPELFRMQTAAYRESLLPMADWMDSMVVSNMARRTLADWISSPVAAEYALTPDYDDQWRSGGSLDEILEEAHLSPEWIVSGIERFVQERAERLRRLGIR